VAQVGRISGPLLQANLERNGIDLAFRNDLNTSQLIYLDVINGKIAINHNAPSAELDVLGTIQTTNLISDFSNIAGYTVTDSTLSTIGNLNLNAATAIVFTTLENGTIRINDNIVSTIESNADIDITPNGTGTTEVLKDLNVFGDMYTPGNITFDGTITLGDADTDNVTFESDISSDIIPDSNNTYDLGSESKRWETLYTNLLNGRAAEVDGYTLNGVDLLTRHGGIIYVAQEGNDANSGDHILDPLATISEALSRADASGEQPFTILVAAGEYQEALPLVVPANVSVIGQDIRNTVITPDTSSQSADVFHLNDKTTIANLTIKNHYYDSVNNTGYAFRFAPNAVMSERSPYIQNVTVLTQETALGTGDAGRGAWIDGDELNAATVNKTMLFHSCTFISPGADVINMTNNVRVEWLNSFTYYANRGLYAFAGTGGGAELRSIGSANVYGNYGAVADGADTLMYLIQHNFGYIGAGNKNDNNEADVIQANEVVELNSGQIHFVSTDQKGNFRVGDNFFVDLETGNSSISIDTADIDSLSGLNITSPGGTTVIAGSNIQTGNIIITGNNISTPVGDLNLEGATNTINITSGTNVFGNLDIRDDFSFGGTLTVAGNQPGRNTDSDTLTFNVDLEQDFKPHVTLTHSLGEAVRPWLNVNLDRAEIDDIIIDENYITTDISNANLDLRSTNRIYVPNNNLQIDNNLTVDGTINIQGTDLSGTINYVGDRTQTGNYSIFGEISNGTIEIEDNFIHTTDSNADLELRASGTGEVLISDSIQIDNNLTVSTLTDLQDTIITGTLTHTSNRVQTGDYTLANYNIDGNIDISSQAQFEEILFDGNFITTTTSNTDLELIANGTGRILVPTENVQVNNNLSADNIFNNNNVNITLQTEFVSADVGDFDIVGNYISTNNSNTDLELRASGTGNVNVEDSTLLNQNLTVNKKTFLQNGTTTYEYGPELVVNGTFDTNVNGWAQAGGGSANDVNGNLQINSTGAARNVSQEITVVAGKAYDFEAQFRSVSNGNPFYLRIFESGVGTLQEWNETSGLTADQLLTYSFVPQSTEIDIIFRSVDNIVEWDNVSMFEDIGLVTEFTPVQVNITGTNTQTGNTVQTGNITQTGNINAIGNLTVSNEFTKSNININENIIQNTGEGLRTAREPNDPNSIPAIVQAIAAGSTADDYASQTEKNLINFLVDNDYADINNNGSVTTSDYLAYLQYIANGTSGNAGIDIKIASILEEMIILENATPGYFNNIIFDGDYFNPNLELRAAGTGNVVFSNPTVNIANNLLVSDTLFADTIVAPSNAAISSTNFTTSNTTTLDDNFISTIISNANLELRAFEDNLVYVPSANVTVDNNLTVSRITDIDDTTIVGNITQTGNRTQLGNISVTGNVTVSTSNIQDDLQLDDILIDRNIIESQDSNANLELSAQGAGAIEVPGNNVQVDTNLNVSDIIAPNININNNFSFEDFELSSNITIFDNVITTTDSNSNLELRTIDNSNIELQNILVNSNSISTSIADINIASNSLVNIDSSNAVKIPVGDTAQRQVVNNSIRFNTTSNVFEGYNDNSNIVSFNGVYSSNRRTNVLANSDSIEFTNTNIITGEVNNLGLSIHGLEVDDIKIQTNNILATTLNSDIDLRTNGNGNLVIDDIEIAGNTIINNSNGALIIRNTQYGNTKFIGPAVKIPSGSTADQPVAPEVGTARWNTDEVVLEVWDGSTFTTAAGSTATINQAEMDDLILEYTLIFG